MSLYTMYPVINTIIMSASWYKTAKYCEKEYGIQADWEEGFFICPECGEPIYECDWEDEEFLFCPICEYYF